MCHLYHIENSLLETIYPDLLQRGRRQSTLHQIMAANAHLSNPDPEYAAIVSQIPPQPTIYDPLVAQAVFLEMSIPMMQNTWKAYLPPGK